MNKIHSLTLISFIILSIFNIAQVAAEDIPLRGPIPFETMDKNGDKMLSPDEYIEAHNERMKMRMNQGMRMRDTMHPGFTYFDQDFDNKISQEELEKGRAAWKERNQQMGMGSKGTGMGRGRNMPSFEDFDSNKDGVLLKDEFYDARAKRMYDRAEQGYRLKRAVDAATFEEIDTNGDMKISKEEFEAHQADCMYKRRQ